MYALVIVENNEPTLRGLFPTITELRTEQQRCLELSRDSNVDIAFHIFMEDSRKPCGNLSEREVEVVQLIAHGLTNEAIGQRLYITTNTVKNHITTIKNKLGLDNRQQVAVYAVQNSLI